MSNSLDQTFDASSQNLQWKTILSIYKPGMHVECTVENVLRYGMYVSVHPIGTLKNTVIGFIRNEEVSWDTSFENLRGRFSVGQTLKAAVMHTDEQHQRLALSLRRVEYDPWDEFIREYSVGNSVVGCIEHLTSQAAFIKINDGIRGRIPLGEIRGAEVRHPCEVFKVGDTVRVKIIGIDKESREVETSLQKELETLETEILKPSGNDIFFDEPHQSYAGRRTSDKKKKNEQNVYNRKIRTVLLVDDDRDVRESVKKLLEINGYEVESAGNTDAVYSCWSEKLYDLFILDVNMPRHFEGIELAQVILRDYPKANILLHTGVENLSSALKEINEKEVEVCGLLPKPADTGELLDAIHEIEQYGRVAITELRKDNKSAFAYSIETALKTYDETCKKSLEMPLEALCRLLNADAGIIMSINPDTFDIAAAALYQITERNFNYHKNKLRYSPVKDVLLEEEDLCETNVAAAEKKFKYLSPLTSVPENIFIMNACIGLSIRAAGSLRYGVFLFFRKKWAFKFEDFQFAKREAVLFGAVINERLYRFSTAADKRFELLGQMTASVGHELRGYLTALSARLDVLKFFVDKLEHSGSRESGSNALSTYLQYVVEVKENMMRFVRSFMEITKAEQTATIKIGDLLSLAVRAVSDEANRQGIAIDLDKKSKYFNTEIYTVPVILQQVFVNLLLNGIQHMHIAGRKKGRIYITVSLEQKDQRPLKIRFRDTGPGIHRDIQKYIFEPMFSTKKAEDGKESIDGTGLGLAICRNILGSVGGRISLEESLILLGSTFVVELPVTEK